ncbi:hypothetical protein [Pyrodictium abyssi]|uniref:DUF3782 domain-containing protein n=1 Tax=Pyrodictium abyssi TaxID=54256 RepID=A0ABM8ITY5_9CREN|nr:hypothetical protein PABY_05880 [Pyrodictium abyssi]
MSLSAEEKQRFLRALEEDKEFRLAVAGLIGLREVLEELRWLRRKSLEHDKRFEAIERKLLEHDKRFEALEKKLLEHDKRFEALERKLLEHDKRFEAIERKLLEHDEKFRAILEEIRRIWERIEGIERELREMNRRLSSLEPTLGALTESSYSRFVWDELREEIVGRGERLLQRHRNARLDGEDIDLLLVTDRTVYVVEVKVKPRHSDVAALLAKAELAARHHPGKRVVPILAGAIIGTELEDYALQKGVKVYSY